MSQSHDLLERLNTPEPPFNIISNIGAFPTTRSKNVAVRGDNVTWNTNHNDLLVTPRLLFDLNSIASQRRDDTLTVYLFF